MDTKKILLSLFLVLLIAISVSSVSAEDATDALAVDDTDDVVAIDDASEVLSTDIQPEENTSDSVQSAVNSASEGDTVDLSTFSEYNFTDKTVTISTPGITIDGKGTTTIYGYGDGSGIFAVRAQNVVIQGIKFIDTNPKNNFKENGTVAGRAIDVSAGDGGLVKNCEFTDFNSAVFVASTTGFTIESNKFLDGYATEIYNDPTANKEQGTKAINVQKQSSQIIIKYNTFDGPMLDAVSIAQGSGSNQVIGNTFIGNAYAIYFGGASTKNSIIENNTFTNCGFYNDPVWIGLPVISIQKSADNIEIRNNTFNAIDNNILIGAENANEAHGAPTQIGNIKVTGNTVLPYNETVNMSSVTLMHILARVASSLEITSPVTVSDNNLVDDVKSVSVWFADKEIFSATEDVFLNDTLDENHVYGNDTLFDTVINVNDLTIDEGVSGNLKITLTSSNGFALKNKMLTIIVEGVVSQISTDDEGLVSLPVKYDVAGTKYAIITFLGEGNLYKGSMATAKIIVNAKQTPAAPSTSTPVVAKKTTLTASKATLKVKKAKKIKVTLKSGGKAVAGKTVTIKVNKKTFKAKTNKKGVATISVKIAKKGKFTATVKFAGDSEYKSVTKKVKYTVKK